MKKANGVWIDENDNKWDSDCYTEEEALQNSLSLDNCYDCLNCSNCQDCVNCFYCANCQDCIDCKFCENCRSCQECKKCTGLNGELVAKMSNDYKTRELYEQNRMD